MDARELERLWEELLQLIEKGRVVPVAGQDLLVVEPAGGPAVPLYRYLADAVASRLGLETPPKATRNPLAALAAGYLRGTREQQELHASLRDAMAEVDQRGWIPTPLIQLAEISDFKLFLTTTIDPLLASALDRVRFGGERRTLVLSFSPYGADDLSSGTRASTATVFHLLGRLQFASQYAVSEEDTLEFVHALRTGTQRPAQLLDELDRKHLLILGSGFSDWLARFFIRTAKSQRLWPFRQPADFLADSAADGERTLSDFLRHFSTSMGLFPIDPVTFVAELRERWTTRKQAATPATRAELSPMRRGAIFVSYASADWPAAQAVAERLRQASLEVWFDRIDLQPGDPWESKILVNIQNASAVIVIISQHTLTKAQKFFRVEWDYALSVAARLPADNKFIYPLRIDETRMDDPAIPSGLRGRHGSFAAEGNLDVGFVQEVVETYRAWKREFAGGA